MASTTVDLNNNQLLLLQSNGGVGHTTSTVPTTNQTLASNGNQQPKPRGRRKKIRTEPIRPICPQCEKQFSNQSALTKHKLTHSDERKFACQQCSKAFKRHDHLTGHMQTHSNRKPFNCTIQGCDKTYCDARSLRRHKENIHHIVTPKDHHNHHHHHHHHHNNNTSNNQHSHLSINNQNQSSHLIERRIQRLHSDGSIVYSDHLDEQQLHLQQPQSASSLETTRRPSSDADSSSSTNTTTNTNTHSTNYHHQHHQCYSADYASNQRFIFDFNHMDQQVSSSNSTLPHSANSVADSGLGHSHQALTSSGDHQHALPSSGGYLTPITLHPTTPNGNDQNNNSLVTTPQSAPYSGNPNEQSAYHQTTTAATVVATPPTTTTLLPPPSYLSTAVDPKTQQPSHLLRRRIQRIHSDGGVYPTTTNEGHQLQSSLQPLQQQQYTASLDPLRCSIMDPNNYDQQQQQQEQVAYHSNNNNHHHQQQLHQHAQCYSADYASSQQFSFNFNNMDQQVNSNTISNSLLPHSANSVADSGLGHSHQTLPLTGDPHLTNSTSSGGYLTPTTLHPPTPNNNINNNSTSDHNNNNLVTTQSVPFSSNPNDQSTYQQTSTPSTTLLPPRNFAVTAVNSKSQQPSLLLRRRHERLHSDGGLYTTSEDHQVQSSHQQQYAARPEPIRCPSDQIYNQPQSYLHNQQLNQHDQCYSADYASTQQFAFEFEQMPHMNPH